MPPPALMDDLVGEVLLRFPPDEPELLVRAALVCKRWWRFISGPGFRCRFREFHQMPPMLGFFCYRLSGPFFVPISSVCLPNAVRRNCVAVDARHGRVLLHSGNWCDHIGLEDLVVWNPITDEQRVLPSPPEHVFPYSCSWAAAVLCGTAGGGCNHLDCHRGSYLVVFVCTGSRETSTCVYSSETDAWSGPASVELRHASVCNWAPKVLVENSLHL